MPEKDGVMTLKVAAVSNPATVAGAIANNIREGRAVELVAMMYVQAYRPAPRTVKAL